MSPDDPPPATPLQRRETHRHRRSGSLSRAELRRFGARRLIRTLFALVVVGYLVLVPLIALTQFARTTPSELAAARAEVDRIVADQARWHAQCLESPPPDAPEELTPEEICGPRPTPEQFVVEDFLPRRPFVLAKDLTGGATAVAVAMAALSFIVGATWIGAEWSAKTMNALLFWETRRLRVVAVKAAVLAGAVALGAAVAQAVWLGSAWLIAATRGSTSPRPPAFWTDHVALVGRGTLLAVLVALIGFAVAHLTRGTGAALAVAFVYFAILENAANLIRHQWGEYLLTINIAALLSHGGVAVYRPGQSVDADGQVVDGTEVMIGNLHGAVVIGAAAAVLLALGAVLFQRRDLS